MYDYNISTFLATKNYDANTRIILRLSKNMSIKKELVTASILEQKKKKNPKRLSPCTSQITALLLKLCRIYGKIK